MTSNNKTLLASGSVLALSIMMIAGLSFASAHGEGGDRDYNNFEPKNPEAVLEAKAEFFNMTPEELKERLDNGETFKDVAESLGITREDMVATMKARASEHVEELRADGTITDEKADEMLERIESGEFKHHKRGLHKGFRKGFDKGDRPWQSEE